MNYTLIKAQFVLNRFNLIQIKSDHMERKVPKYENHKIREREVKTLTRN